MSSPHRHRRSSALTGSASQLVRPAPSLDVAADRRDGRKCSGQAATTLNSSSMNLWQIRGAYGRQWANDRQPQLFSIYVIGHQMNDQTHAEAVTSGQRTVDAQPLRMALGSLLPRLHRGRKLGILGRVLRRCLRLALSSGLGLPAASSSLAVAAEMPTVC